MTTIDFRAPWGHAIRVITVLAVCILALVMIAAIFPPMPRPLAAIVLMSGLPPLIFVVALAYAVRGYTLTEDAVIVRRGIGDCSSRSRDCVP